MESSAQFNRLVAAALPGTRVTLGVIRVGASQAVTLTVADQLELQARQAARPGYGLLGIRVEPVTADLARNAGIDPPAGVVVVEVVPGSPADLTNVGRGDVILRIDGAAVNNQ